MNSLTSFCNDYYEKLEVKGFLDGSIIINNKISNQIEELFFHIGPVNGLDFCLIDDIPYLISVGYDGYFLIWQFLNKKWTIINKVLKNCSINSVSISNTSKEIAIGLNDGNIELYSIEESWNFIKTLKILENSFQLSFSPYSNEIVIGDFNGYIYFLESINKNKYKISTLNIISIKVGLYGIIIICSDNSIKIFYEEKFEDLIINSKYKPITSNWSSINGILNIICEDLTILKFQKLTNYKLKKIN